MINSSLSLDIWPAEVERGGPEVEDLHLLYPTHQPGSPKGCGVSNDVVPLLHLSPHIHRVRVQGPEIEGLNDTDFSFF